MITVLFSSCKILDIIILRCRCLWGSKNQLATLALQILQNNVYVDWSSAILASDVLQPSGIERKKKIIIRSQPGNLASLLAINAINSRCVDMLSKGSAWIGSKWLKFFVSCLKWWPTIIFTFGFTHAFKSLRTAAATLSHKSVFYSTQRAHRLRSKCHVMLKYTKKTFSTKSSYLQPWSCMPLQRHIYCCLPA